MAHLKHIRKYFFKYKYHLLLGVFITVVSRIFSLFMPRYVKNSIAAIEQYTQSDSKDASQMTSLLVEYALIIIGATIISAILMFFMRQLIINVSRYIEYDMKNEIFRKYEQLSLSFYKRNRVGDLMNRISEDVSKVRMYAGPAIMYSVQTITLFACVIPLMFIISPKLTLFTLIPLPILSLLIYKMSKRINAETMKVQAYLSDLSTFSQETFSGIGVIKAYNNEAATDAQLAVLAEDGRQKNIKLAKIQAFFIPTMILMIGLSLIFVIFIGGRLYYTGEIQSIGVIVEFSIYVMMLTWPVATVGWVSSIVQQAEASQKRINEFLSEVPEIRNYVGELTPIKGSITFRKVSFSYSDTGIEALKEVSFDIKAGETVAIIGKTGSGKTTILDLVARMYDTTEGEILIGGIPIKELNLHSLRKAISVVPQENFLFSDTIRNNLRFGNNATEEEMIDACEKAVVHNNIVEFTNQYDSILGERGVSLSGGQRQRIAIARALLKPAEIYLLDDCLSAVDTDTEEKILTNLRESLTGKTVLIVSHRVSITKYADKILMLSDGKVVEQGTKEELLAQNGVFKAFYDTQAI
ncbi:ABC transporter ATP-binding protein [Capnocytophaga sp. oral taxon 878]|uniref:ABC transporter ATP-binding protein n=1 Tax=Capnocytophaga sp. oral taxon 878 TaxID=1316596 RepID=UPI000D029F44|nr:ABC transporter ATP-binding protein [Capnocytophaga sp. oral taxon 878]AVM49639.1 ABC transporter [Capnocytophaga sp. oral taxon 878]